MSYIDRLNSFNLWLESNALEPVSQLLYFKFLNVFNRAGWPESVQVDNLRIMSMTGQRSEKTATAARDRLVSAGLISYRRGKKGNPGRYALLPIPCIKYGENNTAENIPCIPGQSNGGNSGGDSGGNPVTPLPPYKDEEEDGEEEYTPPNPPRGNAGDSFATPPADAAFERFWTAYPKKQGKGAARKAFTKAQTKTTLEIMLSAVECQSRSPQWTRDDGRYIPMPATWLNQERWGDELSDHQGGYGREGGRYANGNGGHVAGGNVGANAGGNAGGRAEADENRWGTDFQNW